MDNAKKYFWRQFYNVYNYTLFVICICCYCTGVGDIFGGEKYAGNFTYIQPSLCHKLGFAVYSGANDLCYQYAVYPCTIYAPAQQI